LPEKRQTANSTFKKVVVARLDGKSQSGYVDPGRLGRSDAVELLTTGGEHQSIPFGEVKGVYFVRNFEEPFQPARKSFLSRPRQEGLWVRLQFVDGERLEGSVPNDLLKLLETGIQITPPDSHGNSLRLFIPRAALAEFRVLGVVGAGRQTRVAAPAAIPQGSLFDAETE
jgi:hypothetical protein